jgi:ABC-2 type transport system permease protein
MPARKFTVGHGCRVILALGWSDFVLKYRGSVLGYCWSLIAPLVKFGVILYVFGPYVQGMIPMYSLYLFLGIIIWEHFAVTTNACMTMLFEKEQIIQRMPFPRVLLIFAVGWTNLIVFGTHLLVFAFYSWCIGAVWAWSSVYLVITAMEMSLFALGVGMFLSAWSLKYRDIPHLWGVLTQILFWLTPIMYPLTFDGSTGGALAALRTLDASPIGALVKLFVNVQPLSIIMHDARRTVLYPMLWGEPTLQHTIGVLIVCGVVFVIGLTVFLRRQSSFLHEY